MTKEKKTLDALTDNQRKTLQTTVDEILTEMDAVDKANKTISSKYKSLKSELQIDIGDLRGVVKEKRVDNDNHLRSTRNKEILREALNVQTAFDFIKTGETAPSEDVLAEAKKLKKAS